MPDTHSNPKQTLDLELFAEEFAAGADLSAGELPDGLALGSTLSSLTTASSASCPATSASSLTTASSAG